MGLTTPEKIRTLQKKLYVKAKSEPEFRFYLLYDKVWRADILEHAYRLCRANGGAAGVDGVTFEHIEAAVAGLEAWLHELAAELREERYRPQAERRVLIPKPDGGERPLGIPTVKDRVMKWIIERIGLSLNEVKTSVRDARRESFDYFGYTFAPMVHRMTGRTYLGVAPSKKRVKRFKQSLRTVLHAGNHAPLDEVVADVNRKLRGWAQYFSVGTLGLRIEVLTATRPICCASFSCDDTRSPGGGLDGLETSTCTRRCTSYACRSVDACCARMPWREPVREPDAGKPHVRFAERIRETGLRWRY